MKLRYLVPTVIWLVALGVGTVGSETQRASAAPQSAGEVNAAIDAYLSEQMQRYGIPGAAVAIVQDGRITYLHGYGVADPEGRTVTPQTPFGLASISKSFTALAIVQLAEAGKLDLDAPVRRYLPWFRVADADASERMKIRHLLYQTSGFPELAGNEGNLETSMADDALESYVRRLGNMRLLAPPGEKFEYSNTNYGVLGLIVQAMSGLSYDSYVSKNIFEPLEMRNSYTGLSQAQAGGATRLYYPFFGVPIVYDALVPYSRVVVPWGGLFASAEDMAHYLILHLDRGRYGDRTLISPQGMAQLHQAGVATGRWHSYAMGWWVGPFFDGITQSTVGEIPAYTLDTAVFHAGSWVGVRSFALLVPQKKLGVVLLMNTNDPPIESVFEVLAWDVAAIHSGIQPSYRPPSEDFIRQNSRLIFLCVSALLAAGLVLSLRNLRRWRRTGAPSTGRLRIALRHIALPALVNYALAWYLLTVLLPDNHTTVLLLLRDAPDLGLILIFILVMTLGWGTLSTLLAIRAASGKVPA